MGVLDKFLDIMKLSDDDDYEDDDFFDDDYDDDYEDEKPKKGIFSRLMKSDTMMIMMMTIILKNVHPLSVRTLPR